MQKIKLQHPIQRMLQRIWSILCVLVIGTILVGAKKFGYNIIPITLVAFTGILLVAIMLIFSRQLKITGSGSSNISHSCLILVSAIPTFIFGTYISFPNNELISTPIITILRLLWAAMTGMGLALLVSNLGYKYHKNDLEIQEITSSETPKEQNRNSRLTILLARRGQIANIARLAKLIDAVVTVIFLSASELGTISEIENYKTAIVFEVSDRKLELSQQIRETNNALTRAQINFRRANTRDEKVIAREKIDAIQRELQNLNTQVTEFGNNMETLSDNTNNESSGMLTSIIKKAMPPQNPGSKINITWILFLFLAGLGSYALAHANYVSAGLFREEDKEEERTFVASSITAYLFGHNNKPPALPSSQPPQKKSDTEQISSEQLMNEEEEAYKKEMEIRHKKVAEIRETQ